MAFVGLIGAAVSAVGTIMGGIAQKNALEYQQQVSRNKAIVDAQNAAYAIEAGQAKTAKKSLEAAAEGGTRVANLAAGGIDVNTGSAKDVRVSGRMLGKLDTLTEMNKAQLVSYGYRTQQVADTAQAGLYGMEAEQAVPAATLGAAGSFMGSAAKWYNPTA
jgi:hypothetical protein